MKKIQSFFMLLFIAASFTVTAQDSKSVKSETVKVWGNCEMCQSKIEKAAKKAGATTAKWDEESKILSVSYNPTKATKQKIEKAVAKAGYDTQNETAEASDYDNLPGCCQYDRKESAPQKSTEPN